MCQEFSCLPDPGGLYQQDAELMNTISALRDYARVHAEKPEQGPGAALYWRVKEERKRLICAGEEK